MQKIMRDACILPCCAICIIGATQANAAASSPKEPAPPESPKRIQHIVVLSNPIFDESDPEAFFIHRWANYLHINTKEYVVRDRLTFGEQDTITQKDLDESQRLLRAESYIRDAKVYLTEKDPEADSKSDSETVVIETWDNWSLLPTASFSSSGGDSRYSFGVKEDNLFGTGISTRVKYQSDEARTGYKFGFEAPISIIEHGIIAAEFYDNDDGQAKHAYISKPFYALDTKTMYAIELLDDSHVDTFRQNGKDLSEFAHNADYLNVQYGWLIDKNSAALSRLMVGFTQDKHEFYSSPLYPTAARPQDRDFMYPWMGYQYIQDDFHVLTNVHLIGANEDFNLGWQHYVQLGLETKDIADNQPVGYHLKWQSSVGYQVEQQLWLFELGGNSTLGTTQADSYQLNAQAEYFYQINPKWTAYGKAWLSTSNNTYLDLIQGVGDETGVRGYPNDYQLGDQQWLFTAEIRNYPNINLYQLANLGWAVFADVGQASGGPLADNNEVSGPLGSVGIGARIYSSRSSYGNVAHIDFSIPYAGGESVNSWEWRFLIKQSF